MPSDKEASVSPVEAAAALAKVVNADELGIDIIGPKIHQYHAEKRRIRTSYCDERDRLQKRHTDDIFMFYRRLRLQPLDRERLRFLSWKFDDWQVSFWRMLWANSQVIAVVCFVAFVAWMQDFWLEYVRGYWMRRRQRMKSQELYERYDNELWELSTNYAERYGWDAIEDDTGYSLRPEPLQIALKREEWW